MEDIPAIILQIFVLLLLSKILGSLFERVKLPKLIGEILAGAVFINMIIFVPEFSTLMKFSIEGFNSDTTENFFHIMGELGIVFLLFAVGLETKFSDMMKVGKTASYIAVFGIAIPFVGGMLFILKDSIDFNAALLIGAALFGTSTAVGVECLRNMEAMNTHEAKLIVSATIIDDILCLALLGVIIGAIKPNANTTTIIINAAIVAAFVIFMFVFISRVKRVSSRRRKRHQRSAVRERVDDSNSPACACEEPGPMGELSSVGLAIMVCFGLSAVAVNIGLAAIIGAFFAGMIFAEFKLTIPCEHNFNIITYFMLPFFFIWVGMELQMDRIDPGILPLFSLIMAVAIATKYVAGYIGSKMGKLPNDSAHLIGVSFIPRGEVGIIVATIGLSTAVFTYDMFTSIILMALVTSILAPPLMTHAYKRMEKNRTVAIEKLLTDEEANQ
ncbi:glutathione-regulated potassium-efflux system protein KefB [Candidatus Methanoplasma termitum]|uniref:KefB2 protein n=1 Tax=Candidatus Methanoplasma termitum TaxID=1577791 RepID=A0A0A7LFN9_9ARCH|nr:cation:proton antiporter [Candidatus Methanoplasma termitum]AIZ56316.1 glutathione-regulated potassium-efflux system protein KefB [Candidatus Methanoplasma termitum]